MPTQRQQEEKDRENFHTGNYAVDTEGVNLKKAEEAAKKLGTEEKKEAVNFDVNFIDDETFEKEVANLPIQSQSDIVFLLGPAIKGVTKSALHLDERTAKELVAKELDKIPSGFRVVGISHKVIEQGVGYTVGDYIFYQSPHRMLMNFKPVTEGLAFYEVRNLDIRYSMTQAKALQYKPTE